MQARPSARHLCLPAVVHAAGGDRASGAMLPEAMPRQPEFARGRGKELMHARDSAQSRPRADPLDFPHIQPADRSLQTSTHRTHSRAVLFQATLRTGTVGTPSGD